MRQVEVPDPARPIDVQPPAVLSTDRTEGPCTLDRSQGDDGLRVRCQLDDRLVDRKHSCKWEVPCYTEVGHRVLWLEREWGLDNAILLNLRARCPIFFAYLQPNRRRTQNFRKFAYPRWRKEIAPNCVLRVTVFT